MTASAFVDLIKLRLTCLALATTLVGFFLGTRGPVDNTVFFYTMLGAFLVGAGANTLNQYLERDIDAKMKRTESRPLPSGRLSARTVLQFGLAISAAGLVELYAAVNPLTGLLAALTLASYIFAYTPLKRMTPLNTFVGAIPGALPAVFGWTAAGGALGVEALCLFLLLYVWQLPHFFSIAWVYREDYSRGGLKMMAADSRPRGLAAKIAVYCAILVPISFLPTFVGMAGWAYLLSAALAGAVFLAFAVELVWGAMAHAKRFVSVSILYLMALIVTLMADKV
ncbi:MAG TPA: heme o synthase [Candidatus Eisenbacteria bacterium]|nr:heme o synthase [Candidatus Eisenbacteria bacterium]